MYKVIHTESLENADEMTAKSWEYTDKADAFGQFSSLVNQVLSEVLENPILNCKASIHYNKAVIKIEGVHHCIAVVDDKNSIVKM